MQILREDSRTTPFTRRQTAARPNLKVWLKNHHAIPQRHAKFKIVKIPVFSSEGILQLASVGNHAESGIYGYEPSNSTASRVGCACIRCSTVDESKLENFALQSIIVLRNSMLLIDLEVISVLLAVPPRLPKINQRRLERACIIRTIEALAPILIRLGPCKLGLPWALPGFPQCLPDFARLSPDISG